MKLRSTRTRPDDYRCRGHLDGTSRQVGGHDPSPTEEHPHAASHGSMHAFNRFLDLTTIAEMLQRTSTEIAPDYLIRLLMETAIQYAGAERCFLLMYEGKEPYIVSKAISRSDGVEVFLSNGNDDPPCESLPDYVVELAARIAENAVRKDAHLHNVLASKDYIWNNRSGSVIGLPLILRGKPIGLLYLENRQSSDAFTSERLAIVKLLASQAASSLENMRLHQELQEREAEIRGLMDSNIIGIAVSTSDGHIIEANDAFVQITGYTRDDVLSGQMRWMDLTPLEHRKHDERMFAGLKAKGAVRAHEREYQRRDGSRVAVLMGCASLKGSDEKRVAFVIDLTERKHAETMLRQLRSDLDHAMRVTTIGELGVSIAHETNQPLTAIVTNASALLRWLESTPPNLARAHETAEWIVRDGEWAAEVVKGLKALSSKTSELKNAVDLNRSIDEILPLIQGEIRHSAITLTIRPAAGLLPVLGVRVQLQQVILNLVKNGIEAMSTVRDRPRELLIATFNLDGGLVGVLVRDTGNALESDQLDYIFDTFYTTKPDGMGMGLSISKSIIRNHGGQIWATINSDSGMAFEFVVPAYKPLE